MNEIYTHYKGGRYTKLLECKDSECDRILVVYVSHTTGEIWSRPKEMFEELVTWPDNTRRPRFNKVIV